MEESETMNVLGRKCKVVFGKSYADCGAYDAPYSEEKNESIFDRNDFQFYRIHITPDGNRSRGGLHCVFGSEVIANICFDAFPHMSGYSAEVGRKK